MFFRTIVAAFFLNRTPEPPGLADLARRAGMTDLRKLDQTDRQALGLRDPDRRALYGMWGAFGGAWVIVDRLELHDCLQIYVSMNRFLDAQLGSSDGADSEVDPMGPFVRTFEQACVALEPDVAFLDTRAHFGDEAWENKQGNRAWVEDHYWMVLESNADALADERFGLLYLSDEMARLWDSTPARNDRDMVAMNRGFLVFARSGPDRLA